MYLLFFGIFMGMIATMLLIGIFGLLKKDNVERTNKNVLYNNSNRNIVDTNVNRKCRGNNNNDLRLSKNDPEVIIEDLIICDILGLI